MTGRDVDWRDDIRTNLSLPRWGGARDGAAGPTALERTSRRGSVGMQFLLGTNPSSDCFIGAACLMNAVTKSDSAGVAAAVACSVMRNVSQPFGMSTPDMLSQSSTRWRVVADHNDKLYYSESTVSLNIFWVDLKEVDFSPSAGVRKLDLGPSQRGHAVHPKAEARLRIAGRLRRVLASADRAPVRSSVPEPAGSAAP